MGDRPASRNEMHLRRDVLLVKKATSRAKGKKGLTPDVSTGHETLPR